MGDATKLAELRESYVEMLQWLIALRRNIMDPQDGPAYESIIEVTSRARDRLEACGEVFPEGEK